MNAKFITTVLISLSLLACSEPEQTSVVNENDQNQNKVATTVSEEVGTLNEIEQTDENEGVRAEITRYGIYDKNGEPVRSKEDSTASGYIQKVDPVFIKQTDTFKIQANLGFGFDYQILNLPENGKVEISTVVKHPEIIRDGIVFTESSSVMSVSPKAGVFKDFLGYYFSIESELKEGEWELLVYYQDKLLASKSFLITVPL